MNIDFEELAIKFNKYLILHLLLNNQSRYLVPWGLRRISFYFFIIGFRNLSNSIMWLLE